MRKNGFAVSLSVKWITGKICLSPVNFQCAHFLEGKDRVWIDNMEVTFLKTKGNHGMVRGHNRELMKKKSTR